MLASGKAKPIENTMGFYYWHLRLAIYSWTC